MKIVDTKSKISKPHAMPREGGIAETILTLLQKVAFSHCSLTHRPKTTKAPPHVGTFVSRAIYFLFLIIIYIFLKCQIIPQLT
jgi:hypothetical protein